MAIKGIRDVVVAPVAAKTFDIYWLQNFQMLAKNANELVTANFVIIPQNSSTGEIAPQDRSVRVNIEDLFGLAGTNQLVAAAIDAVLAAVEDVAKKAGSI